MLPGLDQFVYICDSLRIPVLDSSTKSTYMDLVSKSIDVHCTHCLNIMKVHDHFQATKPKMEVFILKCNTCGNQCMVAV